MAILIPLPVFSYNVAEGSSHLYVPTRTIQEDFQANIANQIELLGLSDEGADKNIGILMAQMHTHTTNVLASGDISIEDPSLPGHMTRGTYGQCIDMLWSNVADAVVRKMM